MATLHITHPITDLPTWSGAFAAFAEVRREAGVTAERVRHPVGDERSIVIDLDFPTVDRAVAFRTFLEDVVWAVPANAPALAGTPIAIVLEDAVL